MPPTQIEQSKQRQVAVEKEAGKEEAKEAERQRKAEGNVYAKDAIKNRRVSRGLPSQCDIFAFNFISLNTLQRRRAARARQGREEGGWVDLAKWLRRHEGNFC